MLQPAPRVFTLTPLTASLGVAAAAALFSFAPYFSKSLVDQGMAAHAVAFYRFALTALIMTPFLPSAFGEPRALLWAAGSGVALGLGWVGYAVAIAVTPVSVVSILYMTYPALTLALAWAFSGERPQPMPGLAALLIVAAAMIAGGFGGVDFALWPYLIAALSAPAGLAFAIVVLVEKLRPIAPTARIAATAMGSTLGLAPLMLASSPSEILPQNADGWALIAGLSLTTAFVPQLLFVLCAPMIGAGRSAAISSLELPTMLLIAVVAFGEALGAAQLIACALVMGAIYLSSRNR